MSDWKITFVVTGGLGIMWVAVWWTVLKETPEAREGVDVAELAHIQRSLPPAHKDEPKVSRAKLLTHRNIWTVCIGFFMINYNSYLFITWPPTYLVRERGMGLMQMSLMVLLPLFVSMFAKVFVGWVSDRMYVSGKLSPTATRKLLLIIGLVMALSIGLAAFA